MKTRLPVLSFLLLTCLAQPRAGLARDPGAPPRALAMGDAMHAMGMGTAGLYFNPATMSQVVSYAIDAGYGYQGPAAIHDIHACAVDSHLVNPELAGGVGYTHFRSEKTGMKVRGHDVRGAMSSKVGKDPVMVAFGAGFRYLKVYTESGSISSPTLDVGALMAIQDQFFLGVSGQNLIAMDRTWAPRHLGMGAGFKYSSLHVGADVVLDFESKGRTVASPSGGLEFIALGAVAIRAGYAWDRVAGRQRASGGAGYISKYVGVDVGYGQDPTKASNWTIEGSIRAFLP